MARFCFVSVAAPAHCDFGGMSYVRTARDLLDRGHEVEWVFGVAGPRSREQAEKIMARHDIRYTMMPNLTALFANNDDEAVASMRQFEAFARSGGFDCVAIDRLCVIAAVAAHRARLPWAAVATDGRDWHVARPATLPRGLIADAPRSDRLGSLLIEGFPAPSVHSEWVTSPFLNISFFPRAYHEDALSPAFPGHVHFVGSGFGTEPGGAGGRILVTFGTTFHPALRRRIATLLHQLVSAYGVPALFLTGDREQATMLQRLFAGRPEIAVEEWMPYADAYQGASLVIGHGGPAHVWYGIRFATPLLAVPFFGDQWHGALQLERLNIGRTVAPMATPETPARPLQPLVALDDVEFETALMDLLTDCEPIERMRDMSVALGRGGGVAASASLLERLAADKEPVARCVEPACCC